MKVCLFIIKNGKISKKFPVDLNLSKLPSGYNHDYSGNIVLIYSYIFHWQS